MESSRKFRYLMPMMLIALVGMVPADAGELDDPVTIAKPTGFDSCGAGADIENVHWAVAWWNDEGPDEGHEWHWPTMSGSLYDEHGQCDAFALALDLTDEIIEAVAEEDVEMLAKLATNPDVRLVDSRTAMQVTGCGGETVAGHVPVGQHLFERASAIVSAQQDS